VNREALTSPRAGLNKHASRWGSINPKAETPINREHATKSVSEIRKKLEGQTGSRAVLRFGLPPSVPPCGTTEDGSDFVPPCGISGFGLRASGFVPRELERSSEQRCDKSR